ncbi:MAG: hypothetical protein J5I65_14870 [Aridibacter famidurans]|nr:hypothetical protein [Aridibacter famidurans]
MKTKQMYAANRLLMAFICLILLQSAVFAQQRLTTDRWREDIEFLRAELPKRHLNLYHTTPKGDFEKAFDKLSEGLPSLEDHEVAVELSRITALIGDGHSGIRLYSDPKIAFSSLPIRLYLYEDGLFVQKIEKEFAEFAGARVIRIGKLPAAEAIDAVTPLISRDNEMWARFYAPYFLTTPEILHSLRVTDDASSATFELEKDGKRATITLKPKGKLLLEGHAQTEKGIDGISFVDARDPSVTTPLWQKGDPEDSYWFEYLPESKTLYFRYNEVQDKEDESIREFADRMFKFIEKNDVARMVVDVRWNRGGSNLRSRPLLLGIIRSKLDKRGKLFLITGRRTFSAAQYFVNEMEMYTNAIVVGEPTASHVNPYGDNYKIVLPNSGITVRASFVRFEQMGPWDTRKWTAPEIAAELTSENYRKGIDPAMEAILNFSDEPPLDDLIKSTIAKDGLAPAIKLFRRFKADKKNKYVDSEEFVNELGYQFLSEKKVRDAISVFKLNTEYYPERANPYDSLGEAYETAGKLELARQSYETGFRKANESGDAELAEVIESNFRRVSANQSGDKFEVVLGGKAQDRGVFMIQTTDGGFLSVGATQSQGNGGDDVYVVKINANGTQEWSASFGGAEEDAGWSVLEVSDGFVIGGFTKSFGAGGFDSLLIKTDLKGKLIWQKTYGGKGDERTWGLARSVDGGFVLIGETTGALPEGEPDCLLIKTDDQGVEKWSRTFGGEKGDRCFSIVPDDDDGYVIAGQTYTYGAGDRDMYVLKTDSEGKLIWSRSFGGDASDVGHSVTRLKDGGFLVTGYTTSFAEDADDPYLVKVDARGKTIWTSVLKMEGHNRTITGTETTDGNLCLTGFSVNRNVYGTAAILLKADANGNLRKVTNILPTQAGQSFGYTVSPTSDGGCVVTGHTTVNSAGDLDLFVSKVPGEK